jgi:hypothetical protein
MIAPADPRPDVALYGPVEDRVDPVERVLLERARQGQEARQ